VFVDGRLPGAGRLKKIACVRIYMHARVCVYAMRACMWVYLHVCMYVCVYVCAWACSNRNVSSPQHVSPSPLIKHTILVKISKQKSTSMCAFM